MTLKTDLIETELDGSFYPWGSLYLPEGRDTIQVQVQLEFGNIEMHGKTFSFDTSQITFVCDKSIGVQRKYLAIRKYDSAFHGGFYRHASKVTLKDDEIDGFDLEYAVEFDVAKLKKMGNDTVHCALKLPMFQDSVHITMIRPK